MDKLWYYSNMDSEGYQIKEAKIIKETAKTFIVEAPYEKTIRKSLMRHGEMYEYFFFTDKKVAEESVANYLKWRIECEKSAIDYKLGLIARYGSILKYEYGVEL